ncbi:tyrosine phosphatase [Fusarium heterosporum]|uniref:Tyrosine phosphatase n=1 Tax=Fusarium heterosporum TaxID=42747 RepID=A0A8H5TFQ9_FUSHE|nr:tyrosine phosphatase [Fusarium heterosporum]
MDRIPKFRRKPKNPTIETAVERSSSDTADSIASSEIQLAANFQSQTQGQQVPPSKSKFSKRAAFRNFRLRGSTKRARDSPPAELTSSPPPAVVSHDGVKSRPVTAEDDALDSHRPNGKGPQIPAFLESSIHNIDFKFQELTWAERDRVLMGMKNDGDQDFKWGTFKQVDAQEKGVMDRYINIKPWNHNRIKLQVSENELDYVNASDITLTSPSDPSREPLRYIAMQGPTQPSIDYVWRMTAEQMSSPAVIVQLTTMAEGGAVKCHQYFPDNNDHPTWTLNEHDAWNDDWQAQITYDSYEELANGAIEKRKLLMQLTGEEEPRVVWHLLYRRWPDFGVPELEDLDSFFELMRLSRELNAPTNPRIIHCSAGVGRTGTFITLEHLMRELELGTFENYDEEEEGPDLVSETVDSLREQRIGMVQGRPQFLFIYQVMRKLWQDKYGVDEDGHEPAAKRLEVGDPFIDGSVSGSAQGKDDTVDAN